MTCLAVSRLLINKMKVKAKCVLRVKRYPGLGSFASLVYFCVILVDLEASRNFTLPNSIAVI